MAARLPAPGRLELVRRFVNTLDVEAGTDRLTDPAEARAWTAEAGLAASLPAPSAEDLHRLRTLREALRAVLLAHAGDPLDPGAAAAIDRAAARAPLQLRFGDEGPELVPAVGGWDGAVAEVLVAVHGAVAAGTWSRLKACRVDACRWAFYDASRNRSGTWCNMAVCGNRVKARAFRARRRGA